MDLKVATELIIPERELGWRFSKEPGPGGQTSVPKIWAMGETSTVTGNSLPKRR
jgi:ribosome-associated protein